MEIKGIYRCLFEWAPRASPATCNTQYNYDQCLRGEGIEAGPAININARPSQFTFVKPAAVGAAATEGSAASTNVSSLSSSTSSPTTSSPESSLVMPVSPYEDKLCEMRLRCPELELVGVRGVSKLVDQYFTAEVWNHSVALMSATQIQLRQKHGEEKEWKKAKRIGIWFTVGACVLDLGSYFI